MALEHPGPAIRANDGFPLGERFVAALAYATDRRGGSEPYIAHLLRVTGLVLEDGGGEDEAIAALLHDAAEDHGGRDRLSDIAELFGARVAAIVDGLTDSYESPKPAWIERKRRYVAHLEGADEPTLRVSLADKLDNVRAILHDLDVQGPVFWQCFRRRPQDAMWYYGELSDRLHALHPGAMADELARAVAELERRAAAVAS
jgi:(p)ppGpp synthase/HD superfamily hydrolase